MTNRTNFLRSGLTIIIAISLTACGRQDSDQSFQTVKNTLQSSSTSSPVQSTAPLSALDEAAKGMLNDAEGVTNIRCNEETCHPSIGALYSVLRNAEGTRNRILDRCTGSLVAGNLVLTNSHCIPSDLRFSGYSCRNRMRFILPALGGYSRASYDCDKIEFASIVIEGSSGTRLYENADIAVISLVSPSQRPPLQISRNGALNGTDVGFHIMTSTDNTGVLIEGVRRRCRSLIIPDSAFHDGSLPSTLAHGPAALLGIFENCPIRHGDSGSPLINEDGKIVGVVLAGSMQGQSVALATNFSCFSLYPRDPLNLPPIMREFCSQRLHRTPSSMKTAAKQKGVLKDHLRAIVQRTRTL